MLPAALALSVALGPLLRGSWDLWAQSIIELAVTVGLTAWLVLRVLLGYVQLPSSKTLAWLAALLALGETSLWCSPIHALALPAWHAFLAAVWIFPAMAALSTDERFYVDEAIRVSAWVLMALAVYQHVSMGQSRAPSAFPNQNVYAGAVLMFLPLAVEKGDWLLAAGLLLNLWWTKSVGAWLGLFGAFLAFRRRLHAAWISVGFLGSLVCLVAIYSKFGSPEVLHRWEWWKAAASMVLRRPLAGYGPGSYSYALPAYRKGGGLATLYAHEYPLQTAAEYGIPFTLVWFLGLWHCLRKGRSYKKFGALAVLIQSLGDWTLALPANLWLFSYFSASTLSEGSRGINVPSRYKLPVCLALAGLGTLVGTQIWKLWAADRAKAEAANALIADAPQAARRDALRAIQAAPDDAEPRLLLAQAELRLYSSLSDPRPGLEQAAASLRRAAALNPLRAPTWIELADIYRRLGRPQEADDALEQGAKWCLRLKDAPRFGQAPR